MLRAEQPVNHPPRTWRELLGQLTERSAERQRVAEELGVTPYTVTRWVGGVSEPRVHNLKRLPEIFPLYRQLFSEFIQAELIPNAPALPVSSQGSLPLTVPSEYLARLLNAYATASGPFRAWSIRTLTLQQAIHQLDPHLAGTELTLVQCVPPAQGQQVRSLCERVGVGTPPWESHVGWRLCFLGAESLAGWCVGRGEPGVVQNVEREGDLLPFRRGQNEKSAVAWPLQREGKISGCLLASSTQVNFFTAERLACIEIYANALALSFRDEDFYEQQHVLLHEMPMLSHEQAFTSLIQFHDRASEVRRKRAFQISEAAAEYLALQEMEAELLRQD